MNGSITFICKLLIFDWTECAEKKIFEDQQQKNVNKCTINVIS